jgi:hypothetical protein
MRQTVAESSRRAPSEACGRSVHLELRGNRMGLGTASDAADRDPGQRDRAALREGGTAGAGLILVFAGNFGVRSNERDPEARRDPGGGCRRLQPARRSGQGSHVGAAAGAAQRPDRRSSDRKFASAVTGRFDIIVDIVVAGDVADLYHVDLIPGVGESGEIVRSETFVVMTSCNKWVSLPKRCWSDDTEAVAPWRKELP